MFRWLEPGIAPQGPNEELAVRRVLTKLSELMVTSEFDENVANNKFPPLGSPDAPIDRAEPADENAKVAAGYTYLGQFIDHDITFDPTSSLQRLNDPDAIEDFRTPRLDLDCLYGRGPGDQPYLYDRASGRGKFILGDTNLGVGGMDRRDLHRTADGTALIGDKRNDENKIVAQIQALFLSFHNKVYDQIASRFESGQQDAHFAETQRIVRWCYQWIVLHDFLPKICDPAIVAEVMPADDEREPKLQYYHPHGGDAYIPVEFSVAAYRFGHSMVRPSYALNDVAQSSAKFKGKDFGRIPIFVANSNANTDAMNGFGQPLPADWGIDWAFFFGTPGSHADGQKQIPQPSYRIDSFLVDPLGALPEFFGQPSPFASLAFRNLQRGVSMGLPSGQNVARMMGAQFVLSDKQLWEVKNEEESLMPWDEGKAFFNQKEAKGVLAGNAPLWFYILKEAEIMNHGHHLGEVGSRIVAETLVGLTWCDRYSYMFQMPRWNPSVELIGLSPDLDMLELTQFVG